MGKAKKDTQGKITLRLPPEEKTKIEGIAEDENRSVNGQLREWIQKAPEPKKKKHGTSAS